MTIEKANTPIQKIILIFCASNRGKINCNCLDDMKMQKYTLFIILVFSIIQLTNAQKTVYKQNIKGVVIDKLLQTPIVNAEIILTEDSATKVFTNADGRFQFDSLPVGNYKLEINAKDFESRFFTLTLTSGKEEDVQITLTQFVFNDINQITLKSKAYKKEVVNELAPISSHAFTVE